MRKKRKYIRHKNTPDRVITKITAIRRKNNVAWMNLLRLAFKVKPRLAKKIMAEITANDRLVSHWTAKLGAK